MLLKWIIKYRIYKINCHLLLLYSPQLLVTQMTNLTMLISPPFKWKDHVSIGKGKRVCMLLLISIYYETDQLIYNFILYTYRIVSWYLSWLWNGSNEFGYLNPIICKLIMKWVKWILLLSYIRIGFSVLSFYLSFIL